MKVIEGRIVHYVFPLGDYNYGKHNAAVIVRVFEGYGEKVNLHVFYDGTNDGPSHESWRTSVAHDESGTPGTWHWAEGSPAAENKGDYPNEAERGKSRDSAPKASGQG